MAAHQPSTKFSYHGYTVTVPQPWPLAFSKDNAECSAVLAKIIQSSLGPNATLSRVEGGKGIYLREPGQPGLSQVGKDTLLRILGKVKALEQASPSHYHRVSTPYPALRPRAQRIPLISALHTHRCYHLLHPLHACAYAGCCEEPMDHVGPHHTGQVPVVSRGRADTETEAAAAAAAAAGTNKTAASARPATATEHGGRYAAGA